MTSIAADFRGGLRYDLFSEGELIYTSGNFAGSGPGHFAGLVSTIPFDSAVLTDWNRNQVFVDNLHFGPPIPAPGAIGLIVFAAVGPLHGRRRR